MWIDTPALGPRLTFAGYVAIRHRMSPLAPGSGREINLARGRLAQLVERLLYTQNVGGSSPSPPTTLRPCGLRVVQRRDDRAAPKTMAPKTMAQRR